MWRVAGAGAACCLLTAALLTYRESIDGPLPAFLAAMAAAAGACALVQWLTGIRGVGGAAAALLVLLVALPAPAVHGLRAANQGAVVADRLERFVAYGDIVIPTLRGAATFQVESAELTVHAPAGSLGYLELRPVTHAVDSRLLPRALVTGDGPRVLDLVAWRAAVSRDHTYFVLFDAGTVIAQQTGWGLLIDLRGAAGGQQYQVPLQPVAGEWHDWELRRQAGGVSLARDGSDVWSAPDPGPFPYVRLGETRTDGEHGGTLRVAQVETVRTLRSGSEAWPSRHAAG